MHIPIVIKLRSGKIRAEFLGFSSYSLDDELEVKVRIPVEDAGELKSLEQTVPLGKVMKKYREDLKLRYAANIFARHVA